MKLCLWNREKLSQMVLSATSKPGGLPILVSSVHFVNKNPNPVILISNVTHKQTCVYSLNIMYIFENILVNGMHFSKKYDISFSDHLVGNCNMLQFKFNDQ